VPASEALARSLNVPAVRLLRRYGISQMLTLLRKAGFSTINKSASHYGLSLILGGAEIKPEDLAAVYASMARVLNNFNTKGYDLNDWHGLHYTQTGKHSPKQVNDAVLSAPAVWETFNALLDVNRPANESGWKLFSCTEKIAWKTGTSYGFRDAWSVGVTPKYVVTVWVGNADGEGRPGMTGLSTAAPLMFDLFSRLPDTTWFSRPSAVMEKVKVCDKSGYRAGANCPETHYQYATKKSVLAPVCPYHKIVHLDATGSFRVNSNCEKTANMIHKPWFVIPPVYEYFYKQKHPDYRPLPPLRKGCSQMPVKTMDFIYPPPNTSIFIPRDFTGKKSAVVFRLSHSTKNAVVFWHLDNEYIGSTRNIHEISITPSPGSHIITVVDQNGNTISRRFEVEGQ
jgi:penicillin-binding protein 1C